MSLPCGLLGPSPSGIPRRTHPRIVLSGGRLVGTYAPTPPPWLKVALHWLSHCEQAE